jgi:hypothetical protein
MKGLSSSDLKILKSCKYVIKLTKSQIIFTDYFKHLVLDTLDEDKTRRELFNNLLGVDCFDKKFVDDALARWRRKIREDGHIRPKKRGPKKDLNSMTIEELQAENAYQKEVIAHLKKQKGLADDEL